MRTCQTLSIMLMLAASLAAGVPSRSDDIPPLRPPLEPVPPGFWEAHGLHVIAACVGGALLLTIVCLLAFRRKKPEPVPPEIAARAELETLRRSHPPDLSGISRVLRKCVADLFDLPPGERTTAEFCRALEEAELPTAAAANQETTPPAQDNGGFAPEQSSDSAGIATRIRAFLLRCDREKFAPATPSQPWDAAEEAMELINAAAAQTRRRAREEARA